MNISDSMNTHSTYAYRQQVQATQADGKSSATSANADTSKASRLQALKAQMQSGQPIDLNRLADGMIRNSSVIDVQA